MPRRRSAGRLVSSGASLRRRLRTRPHRSSGANVRRGTTSACAYKAVTEAAKSGSSGLARVTFAPALPRLAASFSIAARTTHRSASPDRCRSAARENPSIAVARRRQREPIALPASSGSGPAMTSSSSVKIGRAARHRPDHRQVAIERQRGQSAAACGRATAPARRSACAQDAAMKCAGTRSDPPMSEPIESAPKPAASAADDPPDEPPGVRAEIEGIVGGAVDLVVALPVAERERHVGLAEDDAAGVLDARNRERVFLRLEILLRRDTPGRRRPATLKDSLIVIGDAEQRARARRARGPRRRRVRPRARVRNRGRRPR